VTYRVVFRADASTAIGTGHVMRCLTLAEEMIARGWSVTLLAAELPDVLARRASDSRVGVEQLSARIGDRGDLQATKLAVAQNDVVVLDSYDLDSDYRREIRSAGRLVLTLDDGPIWPALHADLVLNPSAAASAEIYADAAAGAMLLLGPSYTLVRKAIREAASRGSFDAATRTVLLVLFGGSDPLRLTAPVTTALRARLPGVHITAVLGPAAVTTGMPAEVEILHDPDNLPDLMAASGLAVSAAGGTLGELAACGVPTLAAVVANNQEAAFALPDWIIAIDARAPDIAIELADKAANLWSMPDARTRMGITAKSIVDGFGAARVVDSIQRRLSGH
jgi:UDP-2,4-diacetamido-2,4,6-trideoxy-beta-L-altropyranose hydrolase